MAKWGYCRKHAIRRLTALQVAYPDIEILLSREQQKKGFKIRVNPTGFELATRRERGEPDADVRRRIGILESETVKLKRKNRRLEIRVSSLEKAKLERVSSD
jgi:hypothetical protein